MIVPVYNNAATLPEVCRRVRVALAARPVELVLVDDASTDDSREVIAQLDVRLVAHARNQGQNAAILAGLTQATQPMACVLDADLEDPPEAIPLLLEAVESGRSSVAFASRDEARRPSSRLFRWVLHRLFPSLPVHACLCFAIDDAARIALVEAAREDDYLPAVIGALRLPSTQVAIRRGSRPDAAGRSQHAGLKRLRYAANALRASIRVKVRLKRPGRN